MRLIVFLLAALFGAAPAFGQSRLEQAARILEQQVKRGKGEFVTFLMGAASAYRWDSAVSESADPARYFCPPPRDALEGKTYARIALEEYRRDTREYAAFKEYPLDVLALALQRGLRARYPCVDRTVRAEPAIDDAPRAE